MCDRKKENHNRSTLIQNSKLEASQQQPQSNEQQRLFPSVMQWLKNITFLCSHGQLSHYTDKQTGNQSAATAMPLTLHNYGWLMHGRRSIRLWIKGLQNTGRRHIKAILKLITVNIEFCKSHFGNKPSTCDASFLMRGGERRTNYKLQDLRRRMRAAGWGKTTAKQKGRRRRKKRKRLQRGRDGAESPLRPSPSESRGPRHVPERLLQRCDFLKGYSDHFCLFFSSLCTPLVTLRQGRGIRLVKMMMLADQRGLARARVVFRGVEKGQEKTRPPLSYQDLMPVLCNAIWWVTYSFSYVEVLTSGHTRGKLVKTGP